MIDEYNWNGKQKEIVINNRIVSREYLTELDKYKTNFANLTENKTENKQNLEKKLIKK